uniref:Appetite-regulating hormone n=2 Tax=Mus TaxID=862507 RepID=A0A0N4SVC9_MOUSE|eukprot:XP_006506510.1 PREDICTED: appetite-regulating hormone isoform X2 [Mus musculus]
MECEKKKLAFAKFNAPFDVGIKLSGAQYQQHGRALGKFLQDILWEEVKEAPADK